MRIPLEPPPKPVRQDPFVWPKAGSKGEARFVPSAGLIDLCLSRLNMAAAQRLDAARQAFRDSMKASVKERPGLQVAAARDVEVATGIEASRWLYGVVTDGFERRRVPPERGMAPLARMICEAIDLADDLNFEATVAETYARKLPARK